MTEKETPTVVKTSYLPVTSLLGAILVILKVLGKITLAWKWVLAPFWIPAVLGLGIVGVVLVLAVIAGTIALALD